MKKKVVEVTKKNVKEFIEKYIGEYVIIPEGTKVLAWRYAPDLIRDDHIATYTYEGIVKGIKNNHLFLDYGEDGIEVFLEEPVLISVDDYETPYKQHYSTYEEAYKDLVPNIGNAHCIAGEIIRAYGILCRCFYSHEEKISSSPGYKATDAAHILDKLVDDRLFQDKLNKLYNTTRNDYYKSTLESMEQLLLDYINDNSDLYLVNDFELLD